MSFTLARTDNSLLGRWWWTVDRWMLAALVTLILCGIVLVTAASPPVAQHYGYGDYHFVMRHLFFLMPSLVAVFVLSLLDPKDLRRIGTILFIGSFLGVVLTLLIGYEVKGATRWLRFAGMSIQPSEFIKPGMVIITAWLLTLPGASPYRQSLQGQTKALSGPSRSGLMAALILLLITIALLLKQPDLGMTLVITAVWCAQYFLAGMPILLVLIAIVAGIGGLAGAYMLLPHVQSRIDRFLNPESGDTYQIDKAMEAIRHGGLTGVGPGQGEVKFTLPDAHADFIFAVSSEEFGLFATLFLLGLFGFLILRGFHRISKNNDPFVILAGSGLLIQFGLQAMIHMASTLHLIPTKGMTLPFISYGGSSLLALGISMGMVLGLTRQRPGNSQSMGHRPHRQRREDDPQMDNHGQAPGNITAMGEGESA